MLSCFFISDLCLVLVYWGFLSYIFDYVIHSTFITSLHSLLQGNCQTSIIFGNIGSDRGKEERMCGSTPARAVACTEIAT